MAQQQIPVKVLILGFDYTDLEGLRDEADEVEKSFRSKGYEVEQYSIRMKEAWGGEDGLDDKLRTFFRGEGSLRVLYYHGHGGFTFLDGLKLVR
jgi:hypothetical protein